MGCVSSKHLKKTLKKEVIFKNGDLPNHVVSLTSSTYGVLKLDQNQTTTHVVNLNLHKKRDNNVIELDPKKQGNGDEIGVFESKKSRSQEELEVINTWELMSDLEEEIPSSNLCKKGERSPFKRVKNQLETPKEGKFLGGKENKGGQSCNLVNSVGIDGSKKQCYTTPRGGVLKSWKFSSNSTNKLRKANSMDSPRKSISGFSSSRRKSLGPLFDPELVDSLEKELNQEKEQIKEMVAPKSSTKSRNSPRIGTNSLSNPLSDSLKNYMENCPPRGENCVVIYTTTLRGIRKTFEDCNVARSVIESYHIRVIERDVSMDSGFKEELRKLMGTKEVKVPLIFVKGRLIGGAEEVVKLDEEGKLQGLLEGIPKGLNGCEGCGGIRFVMCLDCNGSCKVLSENKKDVVRCSECNENGLIHCPICC